MKKDNKWICVAVLAAVVAAVTTVAIILLRARQKKLQGCSDMICDCDCEEVCCCDEPCSDETAEDAADEEAPQVEADAEAE